MNTIIRGSRKYLTCKSVFVKIFGEKFDNIFYQIFLMEERNESKRYYPNQEELAILNGAIGQYFSYGERSTERSKFAMEISKQLSRISSHWNNRAVRLWFTNNKASCLQQSQQQYFAQQLQAQYEQLQAQTVQKPPDAPQRQSSVHFSPTVKVSNQSLAQPQIQVPMQQPVNLQSSSPWLADEPKQNPASEFLSNLIQLCQSAKVAKEADIKTVVANFDSICYKMHTKFVNAALESKELFKVINFPSPKEILTNFIELPPRPPSVDPHANLWKVKRNNTCTVKGFDATYNGKDATTYVHCLPATPERALSLRINDDWKYFPLKIKNQVDKCVANNKFGYSLSNSSLVITDFDKNTSLDAINLNSSAAIASLALATLDSVVCGFSTSPSIYYVESNGNVTTVNPAVPSSWGISALNYLYGTTFNYIVAAFSQSQALQILSFDGKTARYLVGHTDVINNISISDQLILSTSEDKTSKIWDIRSQIPVISLSCDKKSTTGSSISGTHATLCTYDGSVCIFDLRTCKPVVGLKTDEYACESPFYDDKTDTLKLFAVASKDGNNDSLLFVNDDMESSKYIYREYKSIFNLPLS